MEPTPQQIARFWSKVAISAENECWPWLASASPDGYGQIMFLGRSRRATHVALELTGNNRPGALFALHTCDNPSCVNPNHLYWGSDADNTRDKLARGRMNASKGSRHGNSKITDEQALEILLSTEAQVAIARRFGVSQGLVSRIRRGDGWKHLGVQAVRKGAAKGADTGHAKVTPDIVRAIRLDNRYQRIIAAEYGITQTLVSQIKSRRIWRHVD